MTPRTRIPATYARIYPGVSMNESRTLVSVPINMSSGSRVETRLFTIGSNRSARSMAAAKQMAVKTTDSLMYFQRMPDLSAPRSRLVAISLALLPVRARLRLT